MSPLIVAIWVWRSFKPDKSAVVRTFIWRSLVSGIRFGHPLQRVMEVAPARATLLLLTKLASFGDLSLMAARGNFSVLCALLGVFVGQR